MIFHRGKLVLIIIICGTTGGANLLINSWSQNFVCTCKCAYQGVRNVRFWKNLACFVFLLPHRFKIRLLSYYQGIAELHQQQSEIKIISYKLWDSWSSTDFLSIWNTCRNNLHPLFILSIFFLWYSPYFSPCQQNFCFIGNFRKDNLASGSIWRKPLLEK